MKRLLLILLFIVFMALPCLGALDPSIDHRKTWKNAYRFTGKPKDKFLLWCIEVEEALDGTDGVGYLYLSGLSTSAGAALTDEGVLFYDTGTDNLKYRNASGLVTLATSTSGTMDETYNQGSGITVDTGTVALTGTDALNAEVLAIVHAETGAYPAFSISNAGTDPTIEITTSGSGADITGTSATWSFSKTGALTLSGSVTLSTADVLFDATSAGEDVQYDESADMLHFLDGAALGIGGAVSSAADLVFESDGTNVLVEAATQDDADLIFGATEAFDFKIHANTATDYALFDGSGSVLVLTDYDIWLDDTADFFVGGTKNVGFLIQYSSSKTMAILAGAASDDFALNIGVDQSGIDVGMYGTTASAKLLFDSGNDALVFDAIDIEMGDEDTIQFGDTADALLSYDATKDQLEYREAEAGGPAIFQIRGGEAQEGVLIISADNDDDVTDSWAIAVNTSGLLGFSNDAVADTFTTDLFSIAHTTGNITLTGDIINESGDTILMNTDDSYIFTSNDEAVTIQIQGNANAKSAILNLSADAAADNADTWTHTVADGGAYTIANEGTATLTVSEAMDITGTITLGDDELLTNAGDIVDITGDDAATTFAIRGATGNFAGVLEISADDAADNVDTWLFSVADGGAMTVANDGTATMTISEAVTISGVTTMAGSVQAGVDIGDGAAYDCLVANSGKIHYIPQQGQNSKIDLPAEAAGLTYEFWYTGTAVETHDHIITSEDNGNPFYGGVVFLDTANAISSVWSNNSTYSEINLNNIDAGTVLKFVSDGTGWFMTGTVVSDTAPVIAIQ